ncbi:MAG: hypothetical protein FH753_02550 [Firmicutes bacterium]|nr:hypothetical protein [Bacillota bacterium]
MNRNGQTMKINKIFKNQYECKQISSGNNFPSINIEENNLKEVCILLHNKISVDNIIMYFNWSKKEMYNKLEILLKEELIKNNIDNQYIPNCMIISLEEGKNLYKQTEKFINKVVRLIENKINEIKLKTYSIESFRNFSFESLSLFILSDVILDFIQIDNVEKYFLRSNRTRRNDSNYYYSIQEKKKNDENEALGIYGNMYRNYGEIAYGLYGNKRKGINFHTIDSSTLNEYFKNISMNRIDRVKEYLLQELVKLYKNDKYKIDENLEMGFNKLGIMSGKKICIPVLNKKEYYKLYDIAEIIKEDYIEIFENGRSELYNNYQKSSYFEEVTFEEYFIWWYHIFYSRVTDVLIARGTIKKQESDNFSYLVI